MSPFLMHWASRLLLFSLLVLDFGDVAASEAEPVRPAPGTSAATIARDKDPTQALTAERRPFPGPALTAYVQSVRTMAERAYEARLYKRAYRYFLKGLVWRGDKYAQYMVGYMLLHGQGVARDAVAASAWFRLAAERGNPMLVAAHVETEAQLNALQRDAAAAMFEELRSQYGDRVILSRLIREDRRRLAGMTGSRTGNIESLLLSMYRPDGRLLNVRRYYSDIHLRIATRMEYLRGIVELGEFKLIEDEHDVRVRRGGVLVDDLELIEDVAPASDENADSGLDER